MAEEGAHLLGVPGEAEDASFAALEADFALILEILKNTAAGDQALKATGDSLSESLSQMSARTGNIQHIGWRMQLLALNATIEAERLGAAGSALAALADSIRGLAVESGQQAGEIATRLDAMRAATAGLCSMTGSCTASDQQIAGLRRSGTELRVARERTRGCGAEAAGLAAELTASIRETVQVFGDQQAVAEVLGRAGEALAELADRHASSSGAAGLDELAARYTMHSERAVHTAVTSTLSPVPAAAAASDLGENVELF